MTSERFPIPTRRPPTQTGPALDALFRPRAIAIVGATDKAVWTGTILRNFEAYEFEGELYAVNRDGKDVLGIKGFSSCVAIGRPIDAAYVIVPAHAIRDALADIVAAGARSAVILTSGFAESGPDGAALQAEISAAAAAAGLRFLGPNSLGFVNIAERTPLAALPPQLPLIDGPVALVSQSGATTAELMEIAHRHDIGLSFAIATGNEAMIGLADIIAFLVSHEQTKVIMVYSETIQDAGAFSVAARKAGDVGKPIVMLKVGSSKLAAEVAAAHTGALVGNDRVFQAACDDLGIVRVRTVEDLVITAGFMAAAGELSAPGIGVVSVSGGACAMITDLAEPLGVVLPAFGPQTAAALRAVLPAYAATLNPLDVTGAAIARPELFEQAILAVGRDPRIGCVLAIFTLADKQEGTDKQGGQSGSPQHRAIGAGLRGTGKPGFLWTQSIRPINAFSRQTLAEAGIAHTLTGLEAGLRAIAGAAAWAAQRRRPRVPLAAVPSSRSARPLTERETLDYLASFGVPVIQATLARTAREAGAAAAGADGAVSLKIASPDIAHKTEVGGVKLGVVGREPACAAFEEIVARVRDARPEARIDGVIVSPMRPAGVELFVGVARDPQWGLAIVVGLGGVFVEVLADSALSLLPVTAVKAEEMLRSLRGAKMLSGYRGAAPVDIGAAAAVIARIGDAALALGPELAALEINPLLAFDGQIEALDGLATWSAARMPKDTQAWPAN